MNAKEMEKFVKDYVKALNSNDVNVILDYHATEAKALSEGSPYKELGRADLRKYFQERIDAFGDTRFKATSITVDPKRNIANFEWEVSGVHKGKFKGIAPTNKKIKVSGKSELEIRDGKIVREVSQQDVATMMKQMGLAAPAAPTKAKS